MESKQRILLFWGYQRKAWVAPFEEIKGDFDFHYLYYQKREHELAVYSDCQKHYFEDFKNVQEVIESLKPVKIIFMGIDSPITMLLNMEAKRQGIQTFILQHGIAHSIKTYRELAKLQLENSNSNANPPAADFDRKLALKFMINSTRFYNLSAWLFMYKKRKLSKDLCSHEVLQNSRFEGRQPNRYLVYSKAVANIYIEREGIEASDMEEIGFPELDEFYKKSNLEAEENYFLLIDFPLSPIKEYNSNGYGLSHKDVIDYHSRIAKFCASQGSELRVKLHPYQYGVEEFKDGDNIRYFRDADTNSLIWKAKAVYGFSSTLMLPALYAKKVGLFKFLKHSDFIDNISKYGISKLIEFPNFSDENLDFSGYEISKEKREYFAKDYLKFVDGKSTQRLKEKLLEK